MEQRRILLQAGKYENIEEYAVVTYSKILLQYWQEILRKITVR